jgi:hypothetical protein
MRLQVVWQNEQLAQQTQSRDFTNTRSAAEAGEFVGQGGIVEGQLQGRRLQNLEAFFEMSNVGGQVSRDQTVAIRGISDGVKTRLFAGEFTAKLNHAAPQLLQCQDCFSGRSPRDKLHALEELEDAERIDRVGLGPGEPGALKVLNRPGADDHDFDLFGLVECQSQAQTVNTGRFQADSSVSTATSQQSDQLAMAGGTIGQGADGFSLAIALQGDDQFSRAHINTGENNGGLFHEWI